jgi:RNA polymerase sigma-70 factor (ECF subfamily)
VAHPAVCPSRPALTVEPARQPADAAALREALRRAQGGDPDAFEIIYRAHAPRVYALCLRMSGDGSDATALLQDVFVHAWEKLNTFRGESAFSTWLHRVAVNVVLMDRRAARRRPEETLDDDDGEARVFIARRAPDGLRLDLEQSIAALPRMARQVLVLHDIEGYAHREIGTLLGIAEGTSKAHLFRAHQLLRAALER